MGTYSPFPPGYFGPGLPPPYFGPGEGEVTPPVETPALQTFFWTSGDGETLAVQNFFSGGHLVTDFEQSVNTPDGETITQRAPFQDGTTALRAEVAPRDIRFTLKTFSPTGGADFKSRKEFIGRIFSPRRRNQAENRGLLTLVIGSETYSIAAIPERATAIERGRAWQGYAVELYAPDPFWMGAEQSLVLIEGPGITFPITFPLVLSGGDILVTLEGDVPVYPVIQIDGSATNPFVENLTTGRHMAFNAVVPSGQRLELDHKNKTIRYISLSDGTIVNQFENRSATSEFWALNVGENRIRYTLDAGDASAIIKFSPKFNSVGVL